MLAPVGTGDAHISQINIFFVSCVFLFPVPLVSWRGLQLTRRRCDALLLKLDHHIAQLHLNFLAYQTQIQMELIIGVEGAKVEHEQEILTMLRDTGFGEMTLEFVRSLKPGDPDRIQLEQALVQWKVRQAQIAIDRARKREEDEANTRRREEEDRRRILEEEQKVIRQRQEQQKADEEAARRKQEELIRLEEENRRREEEDKARIIRAAQIEAERVAREKAEAERKQREAEIEAKYGKSKQNNHTLCDLSCDHTLTHFLSLPHLFCGLCCFPSSGFRLRRMSANCSSYARNRSRRASLRSRERRSNERDWSSQYKTEANCIRTEKVRYDMRRSDWLCMFDVLSFSGWPPSRLPAMPPLPLPPPPSAHSRHSSHRP